MARDLMVVNGDITLRVQVSGEGSPVVCVSGWPELGSSWHHQVAHLADRGYQVAALDVRGYGGSSAPREIERYTLRELAGDVAAVVGALDSGPAVLVGHDWGSPIVWNTALRHPEVTRAVAGLSVPYIPAGTHSILEIMDVLNPDKFFYMRYFQTPGVAEAAFDADVRAALKKVYYALSGEVPLGTFMTSAPRDAEFLALLPDAPDGPLSFISDPELDKIAETFKHTGFTGAFNRYRAVNLDVAESSDLVGALVEQPSCFIAGEKDGVRSIVPGSDLFSNAGVGCTDFRGTTLVNGAGHWVQQEAPRDVNDALVAFLETL